MAMGDISNDELLLTGVPADALGDEQVDEDLPSEGTGNKEPEISKYIQLSELFKSCFVGLVSALGDRRLYATS